MTRLFFVLYSLTLVFSVIPGGLAGPACARKNRGTADCVQKCKSRWGWSGRMMGTDRWGSVIGKMEDSSKTWDAIITKACGSSAASAPVTTASSVVVPSVPVIGAGNDPAETAQSAPASTYAAVTSSVISPQAPISTAISSASLPRTSVVTSVVTKSSQAPSPSVSTRFTTSVRPTPVPTPTQKPTQAPPPPPPPSPPAPPPANSGSGSTSSGDIQAYLSAHNSVRANHGAAPLTWSDELAGKAQQWVNGCKFQHSGGTLGAFGENLAAGTGSSYGISQAVKSWTDEVSQYNANNPQPSHFTQVVWKGSKQVGCALQQCDGIFDASFGKAKYYVCEYFPAGNVIGQFPQNVQA